MTNNKAIFTVAFSLTVVNKSEKQNAVHDFWVFTFHEGHKLLNNK